MTPRQRVQTVLSGGTPDRPPIFDLIRNDAVIEHYSGLSLADDPVAAIYAAFRAAVDATRSIRLRDRPGEERLPDGRTVVRRPWTAWTVSDRHPTVAEAEADLRGLIRDLEARLTDGDPRADCVEVSSGHLGWEREALRSSVAAHMERLGPDFAFFSPAWGVGMMVYTRWGLETFSYLLADHPDLISRYLELHTELSVRRIEHLDLADLAVGVFVGDDIACKGMTLFSPDYLRREFMPRLRRLVDAYHRRGLPVMFHSDGDLMAVLDDLVAAGIDLLNPIETAAGMDPAEIRRRHRGLILVGGIDVSQLLPLGKPEEVAAATRQLIETAGPGVLVGSSTELHNDVPLSNFQAMVETARGYRY